MCGFIGFISDINDKQNSLYFEKFEYYLNELNNRGPDYTEIKKIRYDNKIINVGFKRLAIQDLSEESNKIFCTKDYMLLFNGEIYNKKYLKQKYLSNIKLETSSDTEVLFNLLIHIGNKIILEIQGIFSIVFINLKKGNIELIRDFTGTKPLYYSLSENRVLFSSEAWFLYSLSKKKINKNSFDFYLNFGFTPNENTLIENVKKVKPRNKLAIDLNNFKINEEIYFDINKDKTSINPNIKEINKNLEDSVELNLLSDTKVGTFLSGGLDSSLITSIANKSNNQIESFTTVYTPENKFKKFNIDFPYSKKLAEKLNIKLNVNYIEDMGSIIDDFYKVTEYFDEPVSNLNFLNLYWQSKFAKEKGFKVILTGDGSDELFCGYDRYSNIFISEKLKILKFLSKKISLYNSIPKEKLPHFFYSIFNNSNYTNFLNEELINFNKTEENFFENLIFDSKVDYINYFDFKYWLTNESNYKLDKCTMINSVEARIPFQDISNIKNLFFIKNEKKFKFLNRKYLLKNNKHVPVFIKNRKKSGWFTPDNIFLSENLGKIIKNIFSNKEINDQGIFKSKELNIFFNSFEQQNYKIKRELITIILFQVWYNKVLKC